MRTAVKVINIIITIGTIYVAIIAAIFVLPRAFGLMPYVVLSGSMEPALPTGSVAFIDQKDRDVEIGDIVTYRVGQEASIETGEGTFASAEEGTLVTHRIVGTTAGGNYITKGDANEVEDVVELNPVQIVGTYKFNIPRLGSLMLKIGTRTMTMILVGLIVLNIVTSLLSWAWEDEEKKQENEDSDDSANEENKESEETNSDKKENAELEETDSNKKENTESEEIDSDKKEDEESANKDVSSNEENETSNTDDSNKEENKMSEENDDLNKEEIESSENDTLSNEENTDLKETEENSEENHDLKETELEKTEENENGDEKKEDVVEDKTEDLSKIKIEGKEEIKEETVEEDKEENFDEKNSSIVNI